MNNNIINNLKEKTAGIVSGIKNASNNAKSFIYKFINHIINFINDKFKTKIKPLGASKDDIEKEELDELIKLSGVSGVSSDSFKKENLSAEDRFAIEKAQQEIENRKKESKKKIKIVLYIIIAIVAIILIIMFMRASAKKAQQTQEINKQVQTVKRMNLSSELSGSGTLSAKDSYNITSLVEGDVISADFQEGDIVKKDQLLITVEPSSARRSVVNASASYIKAVQDYDDAKENYDKALVKYEGNICHSDLTGYYKSVNIKTGDVLSSNTVIGTIYDDTITSEKGDIIQTLKAINIQGVTGYKKKAWIKVENQVGGFSIVSNYEDAELEELGLSQDQINDRNRLNLYDKVLIEK